MTNQESAKKVIEEFKKLTEKECYEIEVMEGIPDILDDKLGGFPYLPEGEEYPSDENGKKLALLLQINLNKIDLKNFPKKGVLEIFTDAENNYPPKYLIKYFEEGKKYQTIFPEIDTTQHIISKPKKISFKKSIDYMLPSDYRYNENLIKAMENITGEKYDNIYEIEQKFNFEFEELLIKEIKNIPASIGGYPDFTQEDPRPKLNGKDECLFKLDSNFCDDINIGDSGILFVFISEESLKNCKFEDAVVDWDSA